MARAIDAEGLAKMVNEEICRCDCVISTMFARRFKKLIDEQPTIDPVKQEWISVKDRLPEPDVKTIGRIETEKVIAWDGNRLVFGNFTIYRHDNSFEFYGADADGTYCVWKVTHWTPLPEPPERDDE